MSFDNYLNLAQMLISIILVVVVLLQARGGDIGAAFGGGGGGGQSSFRTRRGLEKTLFQLTIILSIVFVAMSAISVRYTG
jgi:preprotein translocase subunit SecG